MLIYLFLKSQWKKLSYTFGTAEPIHYMWLKVGKSKKHGFLIPSLLILLKKKKNFLDGKIQLISYKSLSYTLYSISKLEMNTHPEW